MSLAEDCLLATTGLFPDEPVSARELGAARTLPETFAKRLERWMGAKQKGFTYYSVPDLDKLFDRLAPPSAEDWRTWTRFLVDEPESLGWISGLKRGRQYIRGKEVTEQTGYPGIWPHHSIKTFGGPRQLELSPDAAAEVASVFAVLDEPTRLLDEIDSYSLTLSQVYAFRECYPDLYAYTLEQVKAAAAKHLAKHKDWTPTWDQQNVIRKLRAEPPEPLPTFTAAPPAPEPESTDLAGKAAEETATQGDKSNKPKSADR